MGKIPGNTGRESLTLGFTSSAMTQRLAPEIICRFREDNPPVERFVDFAVKMAK